jgi:hypothetical protein
MVVQSCKNDRETTKKSEVELIVRDICISYSQFRPAFSSQLSLVEKKLASGDVTDVVQLLTKVFRLPPDFIKRVGYSANIVSPAMLRMDFYSPDKPPYQAELYFSSNRASLAKGHFYLTLHMIAHEFAHARMYLDQHALRYSEFATDVLALLVVGSAHDYSSTMLNHRIEGRAIVTDIYGYIRSDIQPEVYRCLSRFAETIYL